MIQKAEADIANRLERAKGHLDKVIKMVYEQEDVLKTVQQLEAVLSAIIIAKARLIEHGIESSLEDFCGALPKAARDQFARIEQLAKYVKGWPTDSDELAKTGS